MTCPGPHGWRVVGPGFASPQLVSRASLLSHVHPWSRHWVTACGMKETQTGSKLRQLGDRALLVMPQCLSCPRESF